MTWFRREPEVHWMERFGDEGETVQEAGALIEESLATAR
jgi:hypothetical protein